MEVQIPSVYDSSLAPSGHHVLSVWAAWAPVQFAAGSWDDKREEMGERIIDVLASYAPNMRRVMIDWTLYTPPDLEERVGLTDGNIRHLDIIPAQLFARRP